MGDIQSVCNAVVKIYTSSGSGSGFYFKKKGIIITNHHVVSGNRTVAIETQSKRKYSAKVVFTDPTIDVAFLLTSEPLDLPEIHIQSEQSLQNIERVSVLGFPFGMPFTVTEGIVSSTRQLVEGRNYIQTDAAVNPGNSGGPLVNGKGEVVGITTCKFDQAENVGFAIPVSDLMEDFESFKENKNMSYSVKCPSCNQLLFEKTEYCPNCGHDLDAEALFTEIELTPLAQFIEKAMEKLGIDPVIARSGYDIWEFHQGNAFIRAFVYRQNYFCLTSPLVKLPKIKLEPLYTFILSNKAAPFYFGISEGVVHVSYRVHLSDLQSSFRDTIQKNSEIFARKAEELEEYMIKIFGCEKSEYGLEASK